MKLDKHTSGSGATMLILLCWIIYTASYVGKLNYAANINLIMEYYSVSHAEAGLVSTTFFFSYGIGQVVNGIFCKKYNVKWAVAIGIFMATLSNLLIGTVNSFELIAPMWLVNGAALSLLWPSLIRLLSECLGYKDMARASVIMGTTTAIGTFIIYGSSAALALVTDFRASFMVAATVLLATLVLWLSTVDKFSQRVKAETAAEERAARASGAATGGSTAGKRVIWLTVVMLAICGITTNFVKDGLTTWVPSILKEKYMLGDALSILLTLALPVVTLFGNAFAVKVHKIIPDFLYQCALMFTVSGAIIGAIIALIDGEGFVLPLIFFAAVCFLVGANNSLITSIFPLFMKGKINSGAIAGVLNGFCYVGSTVSSYTLGLIADHSGWTGVFVLLLATALTTALLAPVHLLLKRRLARLDLADAGTPDDNSENKDV